MIKFAMSTHIFNFFYFYIEFINNYVLTFIQIVINQYEEKMENKENQSLGNCDILQNAAGEILLIISARAGGPEGPRFVYDGSSKALLYRSKESAIVLNNILEPARAPIKAVSELLVVEIENDDVLREYTVPVRIIKNLEALAKSVNASI